ncbi:MAG: anion permease [Candidatus Thermoplasmatota archaeon]|nr:anion permease [Candidatus Thermoplasmatota archaeon]
MIEVIVFLAFVAAIFTGISIGASSVPPAFGPVTSSGIFGILESALLAGIAASIGAIVQGGSVTNTIGSGLIHGQIQNLQAFTILLIASILVIASVITKYPMPTAFTVVGAVIGSAFSFGNDLKMNSILRVAGYWLIIPFLAIGIGYIVSKTLRHYLSKEKSKKPIRYLTLLMGLFVAYNAGANSVGLAVGPLQGLGYPMIALLLFGGLAILIGAWIFSPKIIDAVSFEYSNVGPRRSAAALGTAALLAQIGILFGIPISFNEAIIASVIGSGLVVGKSNTSKKKIGFTGFAWISAFFLAIGLTYVTGKVFQYIL